MSATHIVLATRFGPESEAPTAEARRLAQLLGGGLTVVYVATELTALSAAGEAGIDPATHRTQQLERIREELRRFVAQHCEEMPVQVRVVEGDVAQSIAAAATELNAAYLVVGTRGRGALARLVLGDTTQSILQHAPCPVVVVPLRE